MLHVIVFFLRCGVLEPALLSHQLPQKLFYRYIMLYYYYIVIVVELLIFVILISGFSFFYEIGGCQTDWTYSICCNMLQK